MTDGRACLVGESGSDAQAHAPGTHSTSEAPAHWSQQTERSARTPMVGVVLVVVEVEEEKWCW